MSGRRAVWLVARREIVERARERAFLISTAILVLLVVAVALAPALLDGAVAPARVGVVGDEAATLGRAAAERSARD
nr:ABC transporter permease [Thermoleophilaceae bacterium]